MCNLYSLVSNQTAIRDLFRIDRDRAGKLPKLPGIFPNYAAPIVHVIEGERTLSMYRWGMPSSRLALLNAAKKRAKKLGPSR